MENGRRPGRPRGAGVFDDEDLLDRALDALAAGGYRSMSMRGLARDLGVSLASVQHRYATKDELWRAAIDHAVEPEAVALTGTPLTDVLQARLAWSAARPGLLLALLTDDAPGHEERHRYLASRIEPAFVGARTLFGQVREMGLAREIDLEVLIAVMLTGAGALALLPTAVTDVLELGEDPMGRLADGLADLLLFGIVAREPA